MKLKPSARLDQRGAMLIEVLVALLILLLIMVGVMQLFAAALVSDRAADARTELSFKAQQVVEVLRMANAVARTSNPLPAALSQANTGISFPISAAKQYTVLPLTSSDSCWAFWGPGGTGVIDGEGVPYMIGYQITDGDTSGAAGNWVLTVTALPRSGSGDPDVKAQKVVRYVAAIPK